MPIRIDTSSDNRQDLRIADELFAAGKFNEAEPVYMQVGASHLDAYVSTRLGHLALLGNQLKEARYWLTRACELDPESAWAHALLAEAYYRADDFANAARRFRALRRDALAQKLEGFAGLTPYELDSPAAVAILPWTASEPLPVVQTWINGHKANLIIDTGAGELVLDKEFARTAGVTDGDVEQGSFAGGRLSLVRHGRVDTVTLDAFNVHHVPVQTVEIEPLFAPFFPDMPVHGIIGSVLLYHFSPTLDYPGRALVLRAVTPLAGADTELRATGAEHALVPFWLAGDHYMVAWGTINQEYSTMMFIDTGMAGAAFAAPRSTAQDAGLRLSRGPRETGYGGGGAVRTVPFSVDALQLGEVCQRHLTGMMLDAFPLEHQFGFRIGGLLAHDFFHQYVVDIDFARMTLTLSST